LLASECPGGLRYEVQAVVTQPDRAAGRGQKLTPPPVKSGAESAGIPVFQPERLRNNREALELLQRLEPDLLVVAAFGQILPREFFSFPRFGAVNVHASLLPRYRGAAPLVHAILNGERESGITIMKIAEGLDCGDVLSQIRFSIDENVTAGELELSAAVTGAQLLVDTLPGYLAGDIVGVPQDSVAVTLAPLVRKGDGRVNWGRPASQVHNLIRAFNPWPSAFSTLRGAEVKIWLSVVVDAGSVAGYDPGGVLKVQGTDLWVQCGGGTVLGVREAQLAGRRRCSGRDLANGLKLRAGERFE
jgi:methionyl-tRNA formyltransferase